MKKASTEKEYQNLAVILRAMDGYKNTTELANGCETQYGVLKQRREEQERRKEKNERAAEWRRRQLNFLYTSPFTLVQFSGRTRRRNYWGFLLVSWLLVFLFDYNGANVLGTGTIHNGVTFTGISILKPNSDMDMWILIAFSISLLAITVRRLHDIGSSGWWVLLNFIPYLGWLIFLYFMLKGGEPGYNQYGPNPR